MTNYRRNGWIIVCVMIGLQACSTTPREFTPTVTGPSPAASPQFELVLDDCKVMVASGRRSDFKSGRGASVAAGGAVGVGVGLASGASAASGMGMMAGTAGAAGLAVGFLIAAPVATVVVSKTIRAHKEHEIKTATEACLRENGYEVSDWRRTPRAAKTS